MKDVYSQSVNPYGKQNKERIQDALAGLKARASQMRLGITVSLGLIFILNASSLKAQNCPGPATPLHTQNANENTYYPGMTASLAAGANSITLGTAGAGANFGSTPIATGDIVLVIQMQGAKINVPGVVNSGLYGANFSGKSSGFLPTNMLAGTMEFAVATNAVPLLGGVLNLSAGLTYSYQNSAFGADGQYTYQVVRVPSFYNIQLTSTITTPQWNGAVGGVTVINAVNQLDLNSQLITALGAGFRGGGGIAKSGAPGSLLDNYTMSTNNANGGKGEGIAGTPRYLNVNLVLVDNVVEGYPGGSFARGAPGNAGGGATDSNPPANDQNAGGGGGGNGGTGGQGGNGWKTVGVSGGKGGFQFTSLTPGIVNYSSPSRLIMGGGGGAGDTNNSTGSLGAFSSSGASGGGIVIISATTIIGTGTINTNGDSFDKTVINDGSGGGGAGGSVLIYANSGQAGITATAIGGKGINNYPFSATATQHGPGGGGGGGVIYSNAAINVASSVTGGTAGISQGTSATDNFGAGNGSVGILTQTFPFSQLPPNMQICQTIILPVTILSFNAHYVSANNVKVSWSTTDEVNASYFSVERSTNAADFGEIAQVNASESINPVHDYSVNDQLYNVNSNIVYYRLRIVDKDGKYTYSKIVQVKLDQPENNLSVYPNPVDNYAIVNLFSDKPGNGMLRLFDNAGKQILIRSFNVNSGNNNLVVDQLAGLQRGIYVIQVMVNNNLYNQKIIKK